MLVIAGDVTSPRWFILNPPSGVTLISGAQLFIPEDEEVVVGVTGPSAARSSRECYVTWSGHKLVQAIAP